VPNGLAVYGSQEAPNGMGGPREREAAIREKLLHRLTDSSPSSLGRPHSIRNPSAWEKWRGYAQYPMADSQRGQFN
jgi:hypothetical protein